jgi:hypothetical protein
MIVSISKVRTSFIPLKRKGEESLGQKGGSMSNNAHVSSESTTCSDYY